MACCGRADVLSGILNGIDTSVWNPAHDPYLAARFDADRLTERAANKAALQALCGLEREPTMPLFGVVSRRPHKRGLTCVFIALPTLLGSGAQLVVLGSGDAQLEADLRSAADANPGRVGVRIGYDEEWRI